MTAGGAVRAVAVALVAGCGGADRPVVGDRGEEPEQALRLTDAHRYTFSSEVWTTPIAVEPGADLTVDWSAMTTDLRGRPIDPAGVDDVRLWAVGAAAGDPYAALTEGSPEEGVVDVVAWFDNALGATSTPLSAFGFVGVPFDPAEVVASKDTWVVTLSNRPERGMDLLTLVVLAPTSGSTNRDVRLTDELSRIGKLQVDLAGAAPLRVAPGGATLDWSDVTVDVFGHPFDPLVADELVLGHFPGDVESVEADVLRLEAEADAWYRLDVFGVTEADLAEASDGARRFRGFTADGTWVVGLVCSGCATPVPLVLAHVAVR